MQKIKVSELNIYPVKSLAGISLNSSELDGMGLKYDRHWMLVSPDGTFLSQRKQPQMALIKTAFRNNHLVLIKEGKEDLLIPLECDPLSKTMKVSIWSDSVQALLVGKAHDIWLSEALGLPCHLVQFNDASHRQCDLAYSQKGDQTGFSDGFPILVVSEASLDELNSRLNQSGADSVQMNRFRPNIVVSGCDAFAEDTWRDFTIGNVPMRGVKLCERCVLTTVDPITGKRAGKEPLATLAKFRRIENRVCFGMNVIHQKKGMIAVDDELVIAQKG